MFEKRLSVHGFFEKVIIEKVIFEKVIESRDPPPHPITLENPKQSDMIRTLFCSILVLALAASCGNNSRPTGEAPAADSIYTIGYINHISHTQPERALAIIDTIEERKLMKPNDINGLRAVIYQNGLGQSNLSMKYTMKIYHSPEMKTDTAMAIKTYMMLSALANMNSHSADVMKYANEGIALARKAGNHLAEARLLQIAASTLSNLGHQQEAVSYIDRGTDLLQTYGSKNNYEAREHLIHGLIMKANILISEKKYAQALSLSDPIQDAFSLLSECEDLPEGHAEKFRRDINYYLLSCYTEMDMFDKAAVCFEHIMQARHDEETGKMVAFYLIKVKRYDEAFQHIHAAKQYYVQCRDTINQFYIENILAQEVDLLKGVGRYKEAIGVAQTIANIQDSIIKREREQEAQEMATIYVTAEKELLIAQQAEKLRSGRIIVGLSVALLAVALVVIVIVMRYNRTIKRKNRAAVATIDELMAARGQLDRKNASAEAATTDATTTSDASNETASTEVASTETTSTAAAAVTSVSPQQSPATNSEESKDSEEKPPHQKDIEELRRAIEENKLYLDPLFDRNKAVETFPELNVRTLSAEFNLNYGMPFPRYLTMLRLDYALSLLCSNQDMSIETIATKFGFTTRQTFYRTFSERFDISPAEYRRMKKEA